MDANDYALKLTPATKSLGLVIRKALWLGKGQAPAQSPLAAPMTETVTETVIEATSVEATTALSLAAHSPSSDVLPASPLPPVPSADSPAIIGDSEAQFSFGERRYRVRGWAKNLSYDVLKVNLLVSQGEAFYVDTIDLYSAKHRAGYLSHAAVELQLNEDVIKQDLGRVLLKLEALQDERIQQALTPKPVEAVSIDAAAREAALALLRDVKLFDRILADFDAIGLVGEASNKLMGYLAATSRKLDAPLAVVIQSSSAAGKTALMDAVLTFMPEEERIKYSARQAA